MGWLRKTSGSLEFQRFSGSENAEPGILGGLQFVLGKGPVADPHLGTLAPAGKAQPLVEGFVLGSFGEEERTLGETSHHRSESLELGL